MPALSSQQVLQPCLSWQGEALRACRQLSKHWVMNRVLGCSALAFHRGPFWTLDQAREVDVLIVPNLRDVRDIPQVRLTSLAAPDLLLNGAFATLLSQGGARAHRLCCNFKSFGRLRRFRVFLGGRGEPAPFSQSGGRL